MGHHSPHHRMQQWLIRCATLSCVLVVILACAAVSFGPLHRSLPPYTSTFGSSGACQSAAEPDHSATQATLATVVSRGPNTTICLLDPSNGLLEQHHDLPVHGDVLGYADGLLYIHERGGDDGHGVALCALTIRDGQQRWCQPGIEAPGMEFSFSRILSENGLLYLALDYFPARLARPPLTTASPGTPIPTPIPTFTPTPTAGSPSATTTLYALNESEGTIAWTVRGIERARGWNGGLVLALGQGMVYLGLQARGMNHICALQATTGRQVWCALLDQPSLEGMVVADGQVYVRASNTEPYYEASSAVEVYALDAATGEQRWFTSLPGLAGIFRPVLVATQGAVYIDVPRCHCDAYHPSSDDSNELFALSASTGSQVWSTTISTGVWTIAPTEAVLYVGTQLSGGITALRVSDGTHLWQKRLPPNLPSGFYDIIDTMVLSSQMLYVSVRYSPYGDELLAVNRPTGHTIWQDAGCKSATAPSSTRCYWDPGFPQEAITVLLPT